MNRSKKKLLLMLFLIFIMIPITSTAFNCKHVKTVTVVVQEPSCIMAGQENEVCCRCNAVVNMYTISATGHNFGEHVISKLPNKNGNGTQIRVCYTCQFVEESDYVCSHLETDTRVAKEPTCTETGIYEAFCLYCEAIVCQEDIPTVECEFNEWYVVEEATPIQAGVKRRACLMCSNTETKTYTMSMAGKNAVYIPGSGINHVVTISSFTQWAVDSYDIVYTEDAMQHGGKNPFVLGHNTRSLGPLYKTKIGQLIYLSINGHIEVYKVRVSEEARVTDYGSNIVGYKTGASLWDTYSNKTLHMYTCYGSGRWLVLAEKV